jgi:DNA polymerase III delta subunit
MQTKPFWITVNGGDVFEGHQGHWADCFFSNATIDTIKNSLDSNSLFGEKVEYEIREMTDEELQKYPEAIEFADWLKNEYGEI